MPALTKNKIPIFQYPKRELILSIRPALAMSQPHHPVFSPMTTPRLMSQWRSMKALIGHVPEMFKAFNQEDWRRDTQGSEMCCSSSSSHIEVLDLDMVWLVFPDQATPR
jgi:hypothetical protein